MINDQFIALPIKEAERVYKRLGEILGVERIYPEGELFDPGRKDKN